MHGFVKHTDSNGLRIRGDEPDANGEAHRARYRWAASVLDAGSHVLDFGCGTGYGTDILRAAGHIAEGYDPHPDIRLVTIGNCYDAVVAFEVLEHLPDPPFGTLVALEKMAPVVLASVPFLERPGENHHHRWFRLQEATFPGRQFAYQYADGTISTMPGPAQNLLIISQR